ncbi:MAG: thiamine phosphate synthase [Coprococcus sp.]
MNAFCKLLPDALVLREKDLSPQEYKELAEQVLEICRGISGSCILHSFWKEALELGCNQIHLPLHLLRGLDLEAKKKFRVIGTSIHAVEEAVEAQSLGATYLTATAHLYDGL